MSIEAQERKTVLVVEATPEPTNPLRTNEEIRTIKDAWDRSKYRDAFGIEVKTSVTYKHFRRAILEFQPTVVHICAHGLGINGIVFENEATNSVHLISTIAMAGSLRLAKRTECVVFNSCFSEVQADAAAKHIPFAIGMNDTISDRAANVFTEGFYDAVFAKEPFPDCYEWGINAIQSAGIPEDSTPILKVKEPELTQSQFLVGRYFYHDLKESAVPLGHSGFVMQRNHALVMWIRDRASGKDTFIEYTSLDLKYSQVLSIPYTSEWVFEEVDRRGSSSCGLAIKTVADVTRTRRVGLDGFSLETPDQDLTVRFEEAKRCIVHQFPGADATWQETEKGQLQKTINYHNGNPTTLYVYEKSR